MIQTSALFFLIGAPLLYALNNVILKRGSANIPPFAAMSISMVALLIVSLICTFSMEKVYWTTFRSDPKGITDLIVAGVINVAAFWCLLRAYQYVPVWQYQMFYLLTPIFSAFFAYLILGEAVTAKMFVGLALVGLGLLIALR